MCGIVDTTRIDDGDRGGYQITDIDQYGPRIDVVMRLRCVMLPEEREEQTILRRDARTSGIKISTVPLTSRRLATSHLTLRQSTLKTPKDADEVVNQAADILYGCAPVSTIAIELCSRICGYKTTHN